MRSFPQRSEYVVENTPPWDRLTTVEDHRQEAAANWTDGAYPGGWVVTPGAGMSVVVSPGAGRIQGVFCYDEAVEGEYVDRTLVVQPSDATYDRIDQVVVRKNDGQDYRNVDWYILQGTPAQIPSAVFLTRNSDVYELCVARIYVPANSTGISAERITDTRLDSSLCGLTTTKLWDLALVEIKDLLDAAIDGTTAGNLQNQIDVIDVKSNVPAYLHSIATSSWANKGTIDREVVIGEEVTLNMTQGNTAAAPYIIIAGVQHNISGMPTTGKVAAAQIYKLKKTAETTLLFVSAPDYICEHGVVDNFRYKRYAGGDAECFMTGSHSTGALTMEPIVSGGPYKSQKLALTLPIGNSPLFNNAGYTAPHSIFSESYIEDLSVLYDECTAFQLKYMIKKAGSSTSAVSFRLAIFGTWK